MYSVVTVFVVIRGNEVIKELFVQSLIVTLPSV